MDNKKTIVIKYGGNAMTNPTLQVQIIEKITNLKNKGHKIIVVHGGGPYIQKALKQAGINSEFVAGQRKTTKEAITEVEKALKGEVNGHLVSLFNKQKTRAIGLSGKDAQIVIAEKRYHEIEVDGTIEQKDLGQVGNVKKVNVQFLQSLLNENITPVITCIADDEEGNTFNINADIFAGSIAGAVEADELLVLTDVDGILRDKDNPSSLISEADFQLIESLINEGIIQGGMIPKVEACQHAVLQGAEKSRILNGTKPNQLEKAINAEKVGTTIIK